MQLAPLRRAACVPLLLERELLRCENSLSLARLQHVLGQGERDYFCPLRVWLRVADGSYVPQVGSDWRGSVGSEVRSEDGSPSTADSGTKNNRAVNQRVA